MQRDSLGFYCLIVITCHKTLSQTFHQIQSIMLKTLCSGLLIFVFFLVVASILLSSFKENLSGVNNCRRVKVEPNLKPGTCACVVGASNGLGKDLANILADAGVQVIVTGRSKQRAERALDKKSNLLLAEYLDLDDVSSIKTFAANLKDAVLRKCSGKLDYLFLNGGMVYHQPSDAHLSSDGKFDRVYSSNFLGYHKLLREIGFSKLEATKTVFVSSVLHFGGNYDDVIWPNLNPPYSELDCLNRYSTSKLAMTTYQQYVQRTRLLPNAISVTCGFVKTHLLQSDREKSHLSLVQLFPTMFNSKEGAENVLNTVFVDGIKPGEFSFPYFFGFASIFDSIPSPSLRSILAIVIENLQKLTYEKDYLWICPALPRSSNETLQKQLFDLVEREI